MQLDEREKLERDIHRACQEGNLAQALQWALVGYGPEIMRLMASVEQDYERSREAFNLFSENLLRELPYFRWECSFRTWAYRLARHACNQVMRTLPAGREVARVSAPLGETPRPRAESRPWQRTSIRERIRVLRESLEPQERVLLMLRVDQRLPWREVARVMADGDEPLSDRALDRKARALKEQFQGIKGRLRTLGMEEGLILGEAQHLGA